MSKDNKLNILLIAILSLALATCMVFSLNIILERDVPASISYYPGDADNGVDLVWLDHVYTRSGEFRLPVGDDIDFYEEYLSYAWYGDSERRIDFTIPKGQTLQLRFGFYPEEEPDSWEDNSNLYGNAYIEVNVGGRSQIYAFSDAEQYNRIFLNDNSYQNLVLGIVFFVLCFAGLLCIDHRFNLLSASLSRFGLLPFIFLLAFTSRLIFDRLYFPLYFHGRTNLIFLGLDGGDSPLYLIKDLSDISWVYRMPGYQLLTYTIQKLGTTVFHDLTDLRWFRLITISQRMLGVISVCFFYKAATQVLKNRYLPVLATAIYAFQPTIAYYEINMLPESISIDMMIIWMCLLLMFLKQATKWKAVLINIFTLMMVLTKPSFLILYPILAIFWILRALIDGKALEKQLKITILASFIASLTLLAAYEYHNKQLYGIYMLSEVSFHNQIGILTKNGYYENDEYPDIVSDITHKLEDDEDELHIGIDITRQYKQEAADYLSSTRRKYFKEFIAISFEEFHKYMNDWIAESGAPHMIKALPILSLVHLVLLPFTFLIITIITLVELARALAKWIIKKQIPYIEFGFASLILSTMVLCFVTLINASPVRICDHIVPIVVLMIVYILERDISSMISRHKPSV